MLRQLAWSYNVAVAILSTADHHQVSNSPNQRIHGLNPLSIAPNLLILLKQRDSTAIERSVSRFDDGNETFERFGAAGLVVVVEVEGVGEEVVGWGF